MRSRPLPDRAFGSRMAALLAAAVAVWGAGCAGPAPVATVAAPAADSSLVPSRRADTARTVRAELRLPDTALAGGEYAGELYLLALDNFITVRPEDARLAEIRLWRANHLYNLGRNEDAIAAYRDFLRDFPNSPLRAEASQMAAQAMERGGRYDDAEAWFRRMLHDTSSSVRADARDRVAQTLYLKAEGREKSGDLVGADSLYAAVSREFPDAAIAPVALYNAGVMAERRKDWSAAVAHYRDFFERHFADKLLPKVMFREAKCQELAGDFAAAAERYRAIVKAHPQSEEAEPALFNAGFALLSAGSQQEAASAFEAYARQYPDAEESANLLFRAVETHAALKDWRRVSELEQLFRRRYGGQAARRVQLHVLSGRAELARNRISAAEEKFAQALAAYAEMETPTTSARLYAAQAQTELGRLALAALQRLPLPARADDKAFAEHEALLRRTLGHFLQALDFKILDWVLPASQGLGDAFRTYGDLRYQALGGGDAGKTVTGGVASRALSELFDFWLKSEAQYARVVVVASDQGVNNPVVEESKARLLELARVGMLRAGKEFNALEAATRRAAQGKPEERIRELLRGGREMEALHDRTFRYVEDFLAVAEKAAIRDSAWSEIRRWVLRGYTRRAALMQEAESIALTAAAAAASDSVERLLLAGQLAVEVLGSIEAQAETALLDGARRARSFASDSMMEPGSLGHALGSLLWRRGRFLDSLSRRALEVPPIPAGFDSVQSRPFLRKFSVLGSGLRDSSRQVFSRLVGLAADTLAAPEFGEKAFAELALEGHIPADSLGQWRLPWLPQPVTREALEALRAPSPLQFRSPPADKPKKDIHAPPSP